MSHKTSKKGLYQKLFDKFLWLDSYYIHSKVCKSFLKEVPLDVNDKLIDIGFGSGWLSRAMAKIVTQGEVVGIDISEESIKKTRQVTEKNKSSDYKNLVFKVADVENIPYPDSYFNCAISLYSFCFWNNPVKCLKEIKRILKPNGKVYILDVHKEMSISITIPMKFFNIFFPYKGNLYSTEEYKGFFEKAGFADINQRKLIATLLTVGSKGYK